MSTVRVLKWRTAALRKWLHFGCLASQENRKHSKHLQLGIAYAGDRGAETPGENSASREPLAAPGLEGQRQHFQSSRRWGQEAEVEPWGEWSHGGDPAAVREFEAENEEEKHPNLPLFPLPRSHQWLPLATPRHKPANTGAWGKQPAGKGQSSWEAGQGQAKEQMGGKQALSGTANMLGSFFYLQPQWLYLALSQTMTNQLQVANAAEMDSGVYLSPVTSPHLGRSTDPFPETP